MATGFNTKTGNGEYRLQFETNNRDHYLLMQETARRLVDRKTMTNADRIRSMSDEELADFLTEFSIEAFAAGAIKISDVIMDAHQRLLWLQQPAEEESHG